MEISTEILWWWWSTTYVGPSVVVGGRIGGKLPVLAGRHLYLFLAGTGYWEVVLMTERNNDNILIETGRLDVSWTMQYSMGSFLPLFGRSTVAQ